jgi:hypothetical protein
MTIENAGNTKFKEQDTEHRFRELLFESKDIIQNISQLIYSSR